MSASPFRLSFNCFPSRVSLPSPPFSVSLRTPPFRVSFPESAVDDERLVQRDRQQDVVAATHVDVDDQNAVRRALQAPQLVRVGAEAAPARRHTLARVTDRHVRGRVADADLVVLAVGDDRDRRRVEAVGTGRDRRGERHVGKTEQRSERRYQSSVEMRFSVRERALSFLIYPSPFQGPSTKRSLRRRQPTKNPSR